MPTVAFLFCVDSNYLERQGVLLARSIRRWGGHWAGSPLHAFRPADGEPLSRSCTDALDELEVVVHDLPLADERQAAPFANKIHAGAAAESLLDADVLVFCDSDTVFVAPPDALELAPGTDAAAAPVGRPGHGSGGAGDANERYWLRLYELLGVEGRPFVETTITGERIRGYWNAGLVAARRDAGVFARWLGDFRALVDAGHLPPGVRVNNMDQLALAGTLARDPDRVASLDHRYNYPIPRRAALRGPMRVADLDELVHLHYHRWFNRPGFLGLLDPPLRPDTPQYRWLDAQLPLEPVIFEPLHGQEPAGSKRERRRLRAQQRRLHQAGLPDGTRASRG